MSVDPSSSQVMKRNKQRPAPGKESLHTSHFIVIVLLITICSSCLIYDEETEVLRAGWLLALSISCSSDGEVSGLW